MDTHKSDWSAFLSPRHGSNAWAQHPSVVAAWKARAQLEVPPVTLEYAPVLACDAGCRLCPYNRARRAVAGGVLDAGVIAPENDRHSSTRDTAMRVLDRAREAGVRAALFTGGGEPSLWEPLADMLAYASSLGMGTCFYTNGFRIGREPELAPRLLAPVNGLAFVRVSVNTVSAEAARRHWGLTADEVRYQLRGLAALLETRDRLLPSYDSNGCPPPSIQISTIVDKHNASDLAPLCATMSRLFTDHRRHRGVEDVMVVRPLTVHGRREYSLRDHDDETIAQIISVCGTNGDGFRDLKNAGVPLFLGFGLAAVEAGTFASYTELLAAEYAQRDVSWANGLFLTVGPDASVHLNTEKNCQDAWAIGNLLQRSVQEIYGSRRRRDLLEQMNALHWGPAVAQPTSRTARLDRIARAIMSGELSDAHIESIRLASLRQHSVLLD